MTFDRTEWAERRRSGIGGSEISAVLRDEGTCARKLAYEKRGATPDYADEPRLFRLGRFLEQFAADEYEMVTGRRLAIPEPGKLWFHPEVPIAFASPDRFIVAEPNGATYETPGVLEIKTHGPELFRLVQSTGATDTNTRQLHWTASCTSAPFGAFTHLDRGFAELLGYDVAPHAGLISDMLEAAQRWWRDHIVAEKLPDPLPSLEYCGDCPFRRTCKGVTSRAAEPPKVKHPKPDLVRSEALADAVFDYKKYGAEKDEAEGQREQARARILGILQDLGLDAASGEEFKAVYARKQESWRWDGDALLALPPVLRVGDIARALEVLAAAGVTAESLLLREQFRLRSVSQPVRVFV